MPDTGDHALREVASWLGCMSRGPWEAFVKPNGSELGRAHNKLASKSTRALNIFCYGNMAVWVNAWDHETGVALENTAETLLDRGDRGNGKVGCQNWSPQKVLSDWDVFVVDVTVGRASEVKPMDDKSRLLPQLCARVENKGYFSLRSWEERCGHPGGQRCLRRMRWRHLSSRSWGRRRTPRKWSRLALSWHTSWP